MDKDRLKRAKPGEIITFGAYPQTADGTDHTPIRWRVLENSNNKLFLLSEYLLDCRRYHGESPEIKWKDCVDMTGKMHGQRRMHPAYGRQSFSVERLRA